MTTKRFTIRGCLIVAALAVTGVVNTACGSSTADPPPTTTASVASQWDSGVLALETGTAAVSSGFQEDSNSAIKAGCQQILNEVQTLQPLPAPPGLSSGGYQELKTALSYFKTGGNQCITGISLGGLLNTVTQTGGGGDEPIALAGESFNSGRITILTQTDSELSSVWSTAAGQSPVLYPTTTTTTTPPPTTTTAATPQLSLISPNLAGLEMSVGTALSAGEVPGSAGLAQGLPYGDEMSKVTVPQASATCDPSTQSVTPGAEFLCLVTAPSFTGTADFFVTISDGSHFAPGLISTNVACGQVATADWQLLDQYGGGGC